jgi:alkanesulfonate monooxygenase SsuD/methylene tetrahydromethanopterin reductase-like flavin-dependent oxidoreductase (luciferase family)
MDVWFFTEQSHQPAWDKIPGALRVSAPGKYGDPETSSKLLNRYLDEYVLADQLGMNIMVNEHHIASTCMNPSVQLTLAVLARQTKQARLLALGSLISNRPDPVRVAEEFAVVDSLSGGRLEMGLVKGAGWELFASNANPVGLMDRYWEAHDLIIKALTYNEAPFSWEGDHFHYRTVNLWPRCVQQPHPPIWIPSNSVGSAKMVAQRGYRAAAFLIGFAAKGIFAAYRAAYEEAHGIAAPDDRLSYMGLAAIGRTREEIDRRKRSMRAYIASLGRSHEAHAAPPGYAPAGDFARLLRGPTRGRMDGATSARYLPNGQRMSDNPTDEELAQAGVMFWGEPQQVLDQICAFNEAVGGFGHFLMMGQAADMSHEDTVDSLTLFAQHVLPTLKGLSDVGGRKEVRASAPDVAAVL